MINTQFAKLLLPGFGWHNPGSRCQPLPEKTGSPSSRLMLAPSRVSAHAVSLFQHYSFKLVPLTEAVAVPRA